MDRDWTRDKATTVHLRILAEKAEEALEQERTAREIEDRARRNFRNGPRRPIAER